MWASSYHYKDMPNIVEGTEADYDIEDSPKNITVGLYNIVAWLSGK